MVTGPPDIRTLYPCLGELTDDELQKRVSQLNSEKDYQTNMSTLSALLKRNTTLKTHITKLKIENIPLGNSIINI